MEFLTDCCIQQPYKFITGNEEKANYPHHE